jgi:hypothetical protein
MTPEELAEIKSRYQYYPGDTGAAVRILVAETEPLRKEN